MAKTRGTFTVFRNRTFRVLWMASLASNLGGLIQLAGAAWLMTSLSQSQEMVSLVQTSNTLPMMVGAFAAGVLADNLDRRKIMLAAQVFMLLVSAVLTLLAVGGLLTPWVLLGFTFLIGCGTALHYPSWLSSIGDIVDREDLPTAVSLNAMGVNITRSLGPAAGGAIVALAGAAASFAVNTVSYLTIIAALLRWRPPPRANRLPPERFAGALSAGLRYFAMSPVMLRISLRGCIFGFAAIPIQALLPLLVRDHLQGNAFVYGVMLGCFGAGAVTTALLNDHIRARMSNETILRFGFAGFAACSVVLALSTLPLLSAVAMYGAGMCWLGVLSLLNVALQLSAPRWIVGRMLALYMTAIFGGMAVGAWIWGQLSDDFGTSRALFGSAAVLLVGMLLGFRAPMAPFGKMDLDPAERAADPKLVLPPDQRSGPIGITVEYEIAESDVPRFLHLMSERRRTRLRDGARRWTLSRDLAAPHLWFETYHFPTWMDYMRHRERRTRSDRLLTERLNELHQGPSPFRVRRALEKAPVVDNGQHDEHIQDHSIH
jgi:MFS family permease